MPGSGTDNAYRLLAILIGALITFCAARWRFFVQWFNGVRGNSWPTLPAVVDIISVVPHTVQGRGGEQIDGYIGTLTYFYRNPDLQSGDYCRMFDTQEEAQAWASSYKGHTVMVHVNPGDPASSTLRKENLER